MCRCRIALAVSAWLVAALSASAYTPRFTLRGDFDGDRRPDQAAVDDRGIALVYTAAGGSFRWPLQNSGGAAVAGSVLSGVVAGDFDGDGRDELRGLQPGATFSWNYVWGLDNPVPEFESSLDRTATPSDGYVPIAWLKTVVVGDFDGDGRDELRGFQNQPAGANWTYDWGLAAAPERAGGLQNSGSSDVPVDFLRFLAVGDFDGDGRAEVRGLQAETNWSYTWGLTATPEAEGPLQDAAGVAVPVDDLRFAVAGDFDGDGRAELRGLRAATGLSYVWGTAATPESQTNLQNTAGNVVPVDLLTEAWVDDADADGVKELAGVQGGGNWWYAWGLAAAPLRDGPLTNANDVGDLATETPWTAPLDSRELPFVAANYFPMFTNAEKPLGRPVVYTPDDLSHNRGAWNDPAARDYWIARPGAGADYLSFGPYLTEAEIRAQLDALNGTTYGGVIYRVDYELMASATAFSATPLGRLDIAATGTGAPRILSVHDLYPQDFRTAGAFQRFSLNYYDHGPAADERLEFRVWWGGAAALAVRAISVTPLASTSAYGPRLYPGWSNLLWNGSPDWFPPDHYRRFDPLWILTSRFGKDGSVSPLPRIDWWRRDLVVGGEGLYPYIGAYDQSNPDVLRYQIRQARAAGIDAFKIYLYYSSRVGDAQLDLNRIDWQVIDNLLAIGAEEGFRIFFNDSTLSDPGFPPGNYTYADAVHCLGLVAARGLLDHPGYLRINGRPVYDCPAIYETDGTKIGTLAADLNRRYQEVSGTTRKLYLLFTAMTTFGANNMDGPYDLQQMFFDNSWITQNLWPRYFTCTPPPVDIADLLARGRCRYDASMPATGYGVLAATTLDRDHLAAFRNLPDVTGFYDWTCGGAQLFPQYILSTGGPYALSGAPDVTTAQKAFDLYCSDAHRHGYAAAVTVLPGHDKRNLYSSVYFEITPRTEADGVTLRWRRMLRSGLRSRPDILMLENWNGYGEAVIIEPCEGFRSDVTGQDDPDVYLKILAESLGKAYVPPPIPNSAVDPIRLSAIPPERIFIPAGSGTVTLLLAAGYNAFALPVAPSPAYTAEDLVGEIGRQGGTCGAVLRYAGGAFETHPAGTAVRNFPIEPGRGYFLRCAVAGALTLTGAPLDAASARLDLAAGYNFIGLPLVPQAGYDAARVGGEIGQQGGAATHLAAYESGGFVTHPVGTTINNFPLAPGRGYFIRCPAPTAWTVTR